MVVLEYIAVIAIQMFAYGMMIIGTALLVVMALSMCLLAVVFVVSMISWVLELIGIDIKLGVLTKLANRSERNNQ